MSRPAERVVGKGEATFASTALSVVNYNTSRETLACLRSIAQLRLGLGRVVLVDNGSRADDVARLMAGLPSIALDVEFVRNPENLGFAAASDMAIRLLLADPGISRVLLLNNDAIAMPGMVEWLASADGDLCAARVMKLRDPSEIDSLGIVMYRSGLASNRLDPADPLLGPTGGCALYSRRVLEALVSAHGHTFDASFFCYAEDTDLALRALLLGFEPTYFDNVVALHDGQASSGGGFNDFVLYHGIRNSIWAVAKSMPARLLLLNLPWFLAMHIGIPIRHVLRGKWNVIWRLYRDALVGLAPVWNMRRRINTGRSVPAASLARFMSRKFYDRGYVRQALAELFRRS